MESVGRILAGADGFVIVSGEYNHSVPPALANLVRRCMEKRPEERFHSAHDLAYALEAVGNVSSTGQQPVDGDGNVPGRDFLLEVPAQLVSQAVDRLVG